MKTLCFLLLFLTLFFLYSDTVVEARRSQLQVDCRGYPRNFCTLELQLMCGSDGRSYSNKCFFCNAFVKSRGRLSLVRYGACPRAGYV